MWPLLSVSFRCETLLGGGGCVIAGTQVLVEGERQEDEAGSSDEARAEVEVY